MKIIDNGKEYIYMMLSGEKRRLAYGSILIRMGAFLKNASIDTLYSWAKNHVNVIFETDTNVDFFAKAMIVGGLSDGSIENTRIRDILLEDDAAPQRELITEVVKVETLGRKNGSGYDVVSEKTISEDFEKILLGEKVKKEIICKLLALDEISYTPIYVDGVIVREIHLSSLGQIISMEVENVISRKNPDIIYRRCIHCGNIFVTCGHAGNQDQLCSYKYSTGGCKRERQKYLDSNRDPYTITDRRIYGRMYKRKDEVDTDNEVAKAVMKSWQEEYRSIMNPLKNILSADEYEKKANMVWKSILKRLKG